MSIADTIQRLVSGLRTPDGSASANRVLGGMRFPQISSLLPYRDYDKETGMFINHRTAGFLLEAQPLIGANEHIVQVLEDLIRSKVPRGVPLSVHLMSGKVVGDMIDDGLRDFRWRGREAEKFNRITRAYYQRAAQTQFNSPTGLPLTLRNYRLFIAYAERTGRDRREQLTALSHLLKVVRATLDSAKLCTEVADRDAFTAVVREMVNHRPAQLFRQPGRTDEWEPLNAQCVDRSLDLRVTPDDIRIGLGRAGEAPSRARVMNFQLEHNPDMFMLWQGGDNISSLLNPDLTLSAPFVMTFIMVAEEQVRSQREATAKYMDADKKANTPYAKLFPGVARKAAEWGEVRERLNSNRTCLVRYYFNVTAFCEDTPEAALTCEQQTVNTFKKNGLTLHAPKYMQMRNWMAMFPFMAAEGLWEDLRTTGATCRAESAQVVNLLPVIADNRLCAGGLLAPSYRNQIAFLDVYGSGMGNTNYNMAVTGTSGAGKTGLVQPILRSVLDAGGIVWVFDMGDGYKSFCENMGGVYLDGRTLKFNPFANITDIGESGERIRDQLAVLASPNGTLDEVHEDLLLEAVQAAWGQKGRGARIDDVVAYLSAASRAARDGQSERIFGRMDEIVKLLGKYCTDGIYGEYFNSDAPSLTEDARMVVLELGGLQDKPALLAAVMFSLIIYIEDRMYRSPRTQKKCCTIDEGWKLLNFRNEKVGAFIETGYRTVRRHLGSFITISQNIKDFDADDASPAAKAAWGNSAFKVILKQDAAEFRQYNQKRPDQFTPAQREIIARFGDAKDQWFSSFMLRINDTSSYHRLFVDPLSRAMFSSRGEDFEFIRARRAAGEDIHDAVWALAQRNFPDEMRELEAWETEK